PPGRGGRRLYPGAIVPLLAIAGLFMRQPTPRQVTYLLLLALAFDMSLGLSGVTYPVLARFIGAFRSLRALARLGIFVVMFLAVLSAYGYALIVRSWRPAARLALCACLVAGMLAEYRTAFVVVEFPGSAPPLYRVLAHQPRGVVAELPALPTERLAFDAQRAYLSTFHWFPIVTGYSGPHPPSYLERMERLLEFPSDRALRQLRHDNVTYVLVHARAYTPDQLANIHVRLTGIDMIPMGTFDDGEGPAVLFARR